MKRPAKPRPRIKDRRFWPSHRLDLEQLERRYYPGSTLDVLGWTMLGSSLAFLSWDRFAAALESSGGLAGGLDASGWKPGACGTSGGLREALEPDSLRTSLANLVVAPARDGAEGPGGTEPVSAGSGSEQPGRPSSPEYVGWDWLGDPLADARVNEWDTGRPIPPARLSDADAGDRPWSRGGESAASIFGDRGADSGANVEPSSPYDNHEASGYTPAALTGLPQMPGAAAAPGPAGDGPAAGTHSPLSPKVPGGSPNGPTPQDTPNQAPPPCVTDFPISHYGSAFSITPGPNGNLWFTDENGGIGEITPAGNNTEFMLPGAPRGDPSDIVTGPDGNLWFTEYYSNRIGRITPAGVIREFTVPTANSRPKGITAGPDGAVWFTEYNGNKIGRITPTGGFAEFPMSSSQTTNITPGPDGNLWFTESGASRIGRITTTGVFLTEIGTSANPFDISADTRPGGYIWFTEGYKIGRMSADGTLTEFPLPNSHYASSIALHSDGNAWFTADLGGNQWGFGRITPLGQITEFPFPTYASSFRDTASGPDGNLWIPVEEPYVLQITTKEIARFNPSTSSFTAFPSSVAQPEGIAAGPDGAVWFTEQLTNDVGRLSPSGAVTHFPIQSPAWNVNPEGIVTGPDGNLWFADAEAQGGGAYGKIGRITPSGTVTEFGIPFVGPDTPFGITAGPDGNVWFADGHFGNKIGLITPAGQITEFPTPTSASVPRGIALGRDGRLWFTEFEANKIGRVTTGGAFAEFPIPTANSEPWAIAAGSDGNLWFTEFAGIKIGKITPDGVFTEYPLPPYSDQPRGITAGPDGSLFFTAFMNGGSGIGRITTAGAVTQYAFAPNGGPATEVTTGPDGALWLTEPNSVDKVAPCLVQRLNDTASTWLDATTGRVAPNTGAVRVSQPLDVSQSPGSALDGFAGLGITPALVYNSDTIGVRPIAETTTSFDPRLGVPDALTAQLTWKFGQSDQVIQDPVSFDPSRQPAGTTYLLAVRLNNSAPNTGRYPWRVHVHAHFPGGATAEREFFDNAQTLVTDNSAVSSLDNSPVGPGWSLAGVNRLVPVTSTVDSPNGVLMVFGSGQASHYFASNLDTSFTSPPNDFGTLSQAGGQGTTYTYVSKDRVTWTYDSTGLLQTVTDPHNLTASFTYANDSMGNRRLLNTIAMPDGGVTTFLYDGNNLLTAVNEPGGRTVTITRNGRDLAGITNPDGGTRRFTDDSLHHLTNQQWGRTNATYSYDALTSVVNGVDWGTDTAGPTKLNLTPANIEALITNQVQAAPAVAVVTDANTNVNTYTLDGLGRINQLDRPGIPSETWQRDNAGQVTVYTDAKGNVTTNTYDYTTTTQTYQYGSGNGDLTRIDYPDGNNQQFLYESTYHHLTQRQDQRSKFTTFLYDSVGNLTGTRDANQQLTQQSWNGSGPLNGLLSSVTDANGHMTTYQWSSDGTRRLMGMTEASGYNESRLATYLYDAAGNATSVTTGQGAAGYAHAVTTTFLYDGMRRVTSTTEGNGARTTSKLYDSLGNVTQTTDAAGRTTSYSYNNRNLLIQTDEAVATGVARSTTYLYDGAGNLLSRTDGISSNPAYAHPVTTSFGYDALNRRTQVTEGFGGSPPRTTTTLYDAVGNVTQITDANSHSSQFLYDALNRRTVTIDALANRTTTLYDAAGNVTSVQAPLNRLTTYSYDNLNRRVETTEGAADATVRRVTTTLYDAVGNVTGMVYPRQIGPNNLRTTVLYDALNRQTGAYDQAGQLSQTAYDATSNVAGTTDVLLRQTTFLYDALNQRVEMTEAAQLAPGNPLRRITTTVYDAVGNVTGIYSPLIPGRNNLTSYIYDALNRKTVTVDPASQRTTTLYDAMGNVTGSYDEATRLTTFLYDSLNQRAQTTEAASTSLARVTTTLYDAVGNVTGVKTPAVDASGVRLTTYLYDNVNRRTEVTESAHLPASNPARRTTTTVYGGLGNAIAVIDADLNRTDFLFDALNRKTVTLDATPARYRTTMLYDAADNVTQITDRNNRVRQFVFDALNRRINEVWLTGPLTTFTYNYDAASQLTGASDPSSAYSFTPDALGRTTISTFAGPLGTVVRMDQGYDPANERTGLAATVGTVLDFQNAYLYDAVSRMTSAYQSGQAGGNGVAPKLARFGYNPDSQFAAVGRYSDANATQPVVTTTYDFYDALGRLTQMTHQLATTQVLYTWQLDVGDRLTQSTTTGDGATTYGEDQDDEDTSVSYTDGQPNESYAYDRTGNRSSANGTSYSPPDPANHLTGDGIYSYTYDNEGNRFTRVRGNDLTTYQYDFRNRLTRETRTNMGALVYDAFYSYDIFDHRIAKRVDTPAGNGQTKFYAYDGDNIALVFQVGSTIPIHRYLYGPQADQLLTDEQVTGPVAGINVWTLPDRLGTVRDIATNTGLLLAHYRFDSFGNYFGTPRPTDDFFGFQAREWDPVTGQYYFRARYYDAATGSFEAEDPLGFDAGDPNLYRFEGNDPTGVTDPSGLQSENPGPWETMFSWDTLWFMIGQRPDARGGHEPINGGVYKTFAKDQAANVMIAMPFTRAGALAGAGYDAVSQGAGNVGDWRQGRPLRGYDRGQTQNMVLMGGLLQPGLARFPQLAYPLLGLGVGEGGRKIYRGDYEEGGVDLFAAGLGAYLGRGQIAQDFNIGQPRILVTADGVLSLAADAALPEFSGSVPAREYMVPNTAGARGFEIHEDVVGQYVVKGGTNLGVTHKTTDVMIGGAGTPKVSIVTVDLAAASYNKPIKPGNKHPLTTILESKAWRSCIDPNAGPGPRIVHVETYGPVPTAAQRAAIQTAMDAAAEFTPPVLIIARHRR